MRSFVIAALVLVNSGWAAAAVLTKEDATRLAFAHANDEPATGLALVVRPGAMASVVGTAQKLGGRIRFRADEVGFIEAVVPTARVASFVMNPAIESVAVHLAAPEAQEIAGWYSPQQPDAQTTPQWPPTIGAYPLENPHSILKDLDAEEFRTNHPSFDGRGVVIAQIEFFPDFLLPELEVATDATGRTVPKFAGVINVPNYLPSLEADAPRSGAEWIKLAKPARYGTKATIAGAAFRLPAAGIYRFGELSVPNVSPYAHTGLYGLLKKVRNDKNAKDTDPVRFNTLWSDARGALWIDTDGDSDFSDETAVEEYSRSNGFGVIGEDDPSTPMRDTVGYAVQKDGDYVGISFGLGGHASIVIGAAAANRGTRGRIDGVAPGAQILIVSYGDSPSPATFIRAMIAGFADPRTDVVLVEAVFPIIGLENIIDGSSAAAMVLERLVAHYGKPAFVTAGNTPGMTSVLDLTVPANVMSVSAYQSGESILTVAGITVPADDLHYVGAEGPAGNGRLKPDFLSPATPVTLYSSFRPDKGEIPGLYVMPPGYIVGGGTSTATPVASGAAALLISAAKQSSLPVDAEMIYDALRDSARHLSDIPAYKQGAGVIRVGPAWQRLQEIVRTDRIEIDSRGPVRTATSHLLETPHSGDGLFEREGWQAGGEATRTITLTRRSGTAEPLSYDLVWTDGVFSSPASVSLPLNVAVPVEVTIEPKTSGAHSAVMSVVESMTRAPVKQVMTTVVAPIEFSSEKGFVHEETFKVARPGRRNVFFRVPAGADAFTIDLSQPRKFMSAILFAPDNRGGERFMRRDESTGLTHISIDRPMEGVWQLTLLDFGDAFEHDWTADRGKPLPPTSVQLRASIASVDARIDHSSVTFQNKLAAVRAAIPPSALGSERTITGSIAGGEHRTFDLEVEDGTELLLAAVEGGNDIDLRLFDCTTKRCLPSRYSDSHSGPERVIVRNPAAGKWKVIVSSTGTAEFRYHDILTHPRHGALIMPAAEQSRKPGDEWQTRFQMVRGDVTPAGRRCVGIVSTHDPARRTLHRVRPGGSVWDTVPADRDPVPLVMEVVDCN